MADIITVRNTETLINRGLSLNLKSINSLIQDLFKRYSNAVNIISGGNLIGFTQTRQIQDQFGISIEYGRGKIVFKNGIDKTEYLIKNRNHVAEKIGIDANELYKNRRDFGFLQECFQKLDRTFDLGDNGKTMQLYISMNDGNTQPLDSKSSWTEYILTKDWIENLSLKAIDEIHNVQDYRIDYLSEMIQNMVKDHEIDFHSKLDEFSESEFADKIRLKTVEDGEHDNEEPESDMDKFNDAMNRLNSFRRLQYGFYEMFKPIGGTTNEKYVKVKLSTDGELNISGVVGLQDCEHVEWEHGTMEYLRSLNTGNQRYDFQISMPFNDLNSVLWWKPDEPEQLDVDEEREGEITEPTGYRYYKPYETERFLRWFGTNYVPILDPDTVMKKTICSIPRLSNDVQSDGFYRDATNIVARNLDMTRVNVNENTSLSLLSLAQKSTIDLVNKPDGQYLSFVVSGGQQTSNLSFSITGKMYGAIQEMNHFSNTWKLLRNSYIVLKKRLLILEVILSIYPKIESRWKMEMDGKPLIPPKWIQAMDALGEMQTPNVIDLLRFRQIDIETINRFIDVGWNAIDEFIGRQDFIQNSMYDNLKTYIMEFSGTGENHQAFAGIPMANENKELLIRKPLMDLFHVSENAETQMELDKEYSKYDITFNDITVDELRERIETFNNLIVRLPVNTYHNKLASRHIFLDWKGFVDGAVRKMVENGETYDNPDTPQEEKDKVEGKRLYVMKMEDGETWMTKTGFGTDKDKDGNPKQHEYVELYIDPQFTTPLVDYSYCIGENGEILHDRWDYWTEGDFS